VCATVEMRISFYSVLFRLSSPKDDSSTFHGGDNRMFTRGKIRADLRAGSQPISRDFIDTSEPLGVITNSIPAPTARLFSQGIVAVISIWDESRRVSMTVVFYETGTRGAAWLIWGEVKLWFGRSLS